MASTATAATASPSQLSCFSAIDRKLQLRKLSALSFRSHRSKSSVVMSLEGRGPETTSPSNTSSLSYTDDASRSEMNRATKPYTSMEDHHAENRGLTEPEQEQGVATPVRAAKIHDFCLGIPFGGLVFSGGLLGFIFSRNPTALGNGVLFGGAILALSTLSLKIWREGKSSLPFILGQIVLSAVIFWKNFQTYSLLISHFVHVVLRCCASIRT
ncbi:hypothetical protein ACJRO7_002311 [Eucalyptus globulus]|uniref:Protein FATTY ACID EXPORT 1, chloroplastic n=1 Tax=Eucalyptus globulus TaxID=34317 RepID=A0ABD3LV22_EUCGL